MKYRSFVDEIEKRIAHNELVRAQREAYFKMANSQYFELMTSSMVRTHLEHLEHLECDL